MSHEIPLTQGKVAIVNDEDYERVMAFTWHAHYSPRRRVHYVRRTVYAPRQTTKLLHRFILDAPTDKVVDHINGDPLDNRRSNLRLCSHAENIRNQRKRPGTSRFKGVHWVNRDCRWVARIMVNGTSIYLGKFLTEEEAHAAYCAASKKYHGAFGRTF